MNHEEPEEDYSNRYEHQRGEELEGGYNYKRADRCAKGKTDGRRLQGNGFIWPNLKLESEEE